MRLFIIRHGETELNRKKILQGNSDSPLTQEGIDGAKMVSDALSNIDFDIAITSHLGRAVHTAELILGEKSVQIVQDENVAEMYFSIWQGKNQEQICVDEETKINYSNYFISPEKYVPMNGAESFDDIMNRVEKFLGEMRDMSITKPNSNVLIVSHGVFIKAILVYIKNIALKDFWKEPFITNLSLTQIRIVKGEFIIEKEADNDYINGHIAIKNATSYLG